MNDCIEVKNDLISRKDLGAAIDAWLSIDRYYHPYSKQKTMPVSEIVDIIRQMPGENDVRRKGRWVWYDEIRAYSCSECHKYQYSNTLEVLSKDFRFCPYCGAEMEDIDGRSD